MVSKLVYTERPAVSRSLRNRGKRGAPLTMFSPQVQKHRRVYAVCQIFKTGVPVNSSLKLTSQSRCLINFPLAGRRR